MDVHILWIVCGLVLAVLEFIVPGLVIIFFGAGAVLTGVVAWLFQGLGAAAQTLLFVVLSLGSLALFRRHAVGKGCRRVAAPGVDYDDECTGRTATVVAAIVPGAVGKVELDGTNWNAVSDEPVAVSERAKVISRDGLTLRVAPLRRG